MTRTTDSQRPIVLLSAFYKPFASGAEKCVEEIVKQPGHRKFIVITSHLDKTLPKRDEDAGMEIIRVGFGRSWDKYLYPFFCVLPTLRLRPLIVHAVMESYAGIGLIFLKWLRPGLKTILTLQSGNLDVDKKLQFGVLAWIWKKIHTLPNEITAITQFLADRAIRLRGSSDHVQVIANGVDLSTIRSVRQEQVPYRIVSIARLSSEKGVDMLLRAFAKVHAQIPEAQLHQIGDGQDRASLEALARELECVDAVTFHGKLPYAEAMKRMSTGCVFSLMSHGEGQGIVFIEAGAAEIPSVATAVGGIPEMVQEGKTGFLVADNDVDAAADRLIRLLREEALRKQMGMAARAFAETLEWKQCIDKYHALWNRLDPL